MDELYHDMLEKARRYCLRGEKCPDDIRKKLWQWKVPEQFHKSKILSSLLSDRFVDEQRFADSFVHDKAWLSKWGKVKIRYHLTSKGIREAVIQKSLDSIDENRYFSVLSELAGVRWKQILLKETDHWKARQKLTRFLVQRGYEMHDISKLDFPGC